MSLGRIQFASLVTKSVTAALTVLQTLIIVRVLSVEEFGLVGLVMSIGGIIGVTQHLGVVDGAIREIAVRTSKREIGEIFWVSHLVRQIVNIPLSLGLIALAGYISVRVYGRPEIIPYVQLFAVALVLQGLQDVLGATLTGLKKFGSLYTVQVITAILNVVLFGWLTWQYGIVGFFWAVIVTTAIMVVIFAGVIASTLRGYLALPSMAHARKYAGQVMRIGAYMYLARIFFGVWQRLPFLVLGGVLASDELGFLNVGLKFGGQLTIIAMALSEVNLSWMSSLYAQRRDEFRAAVQSNLERVAVLLTGLVAAIVFFTPEILYVVGDKYVPAHGIILLLTVSFYIYALVDIGTSSVFVSADNPRSRALLYGIMTAVSGAVTGWLLLVRPDAQLAAGAVLGGVVIAYGLMVWLAYKQHQVRLLSPRQGALLVVLGVSVLWLWFQPELLARAVAFIVISAYVVSQSARQRAVAAQAAAKKSGEAPIICFAGAPYDMASWTNRQHVMTRMAKTRPVLYVEGRVWLLRYVVQHWRDPQAIVTYFLRLFWPQQVADQLYVKTQWNLVPGSREYMLISILNHLFNRWHLLLVAYLNGFTTKNSVVWLYDTEAREYLSAFPKATVVYDCVDDHAAQAGVDRNARRVAAEEQAILGRADLVTVTSNLLLQQKQQFNANTHLVPNAGDVELFSAPVNSQYRLPFAKRGPVVGSVGALDSYKYDFALLAQAASALPEVDFVLVGRPQVHHTGRGSASALRELDQLPNVHLLGEVARDMVPAVVSHFDVCMIPYRSNDYNAASFPLKFWEFMATGKPLVVAGLPELQQYENYILYAHAADEFVKHLKTATTATDTLGDDRRVLSREHTWDTRVARLQSFLTEVTSVSK